MNSKMLGGIGVLICILGGVWYYHESGKGSYTINTELEERYPALTQEYQEKIIEEKDPQVIIDKGAGNKLCQSGKQATKVLYEQSIAPRGYVGGWGATYVLDCQTEYYMYYQGDAGFHLYGPF
ncbi:hypothetical protein EXS73_01750 [Candidatus Pacearchaeota archaeon]|nr:hypothetical protein [Candidatus Pacearchaeota archaeon]